MRPHHPAAQDMAGRFGRAGDRIVFARAAGRLPYDSPLSQHFAKTRQLGERTEKFDGRLDELCRDTIKNTIISLIYGDQSHDHSEAVRYELTKLEKLDAQCWIISAAEKYLEDRQ